MAAVPEFTSSDELERWLKGKPTPWTQVIAMRAALRVLPMAAPGGQVGKLSALKNLLFFALRCNLISSAAVHAPTDDVHFRQAANSAARSADSAARSAARFADSAARSAARSATLSAARSADSAALSAARSTDSAALSAALSALSVGSAGSAAGSAVWKAVDLDAAFLQNGGRVDGLLRRPLWPDGKTPEWALAAWKGFKSATPAAGGGFAPWIAWYDGLLPAPGQPVRDVFGPELTIRIATQPDEWWSRGVQAVNADIAAWLGEQEGVPEQKAAAFVFGFQNNRFVASASDNTPNDGGAAQDLLDFLRRQVNDMAERLETARNTAPWLVGAISEFRDFLPTEIAGLNPILLRAHLLGITAAVNAFHHAGAEAELVPDAVAQLDALGLVGNDLQLCFPQLRTQQGEQIMRAVPEGEQDNFQRQLDAVTEAAGQENPVIDPSTPAALHVVQHLANQDAPPEVRRSRVGEYAAVVGNLLSKIASVGMEVCKTGGPKFIAGAGDGLGKMGKPAVIFGISAIIAAVSHPTLGLAAAFAAYGKIDRCFRIIEEYVRNMKATPAGGAPAASDADDA